MELITPTDWLMKGKVFGEPSIRLLLLDQDVASVQLSYADYCESQEKLFSSDATEIDELARTPSQCCFYAGS